TPAPKQSTQDLSVSGCFIHLPCSICNSLVLHRNLLISLLWGKDGTRVKYSSKRRSVLILRYVLSLSFSITRCSQFLRSLNAISDFTFQFHVLRSPISCVSLSISLS